MDRDLSKADTVCVSVCVYLLCKPIRWLQDVDIVFNVQAGRLRPPPRGSC